MKRFISSEKCILLLLTLIALLLSGIKPADRFIWILEISWIPAGIIVLFATNKRFPLTPLLYRLLFIHALILIVLCRVHDREIRKM